MATYDQKWGEPIPIGHLLIQSQTTVPTRWNIPNISLKVEKELVAGKYKEATGGERIINQPGTYKGQITGKRISIDFANFLLGATGTAAAGKTVTSKTTTVNTTNGTVSLTSICTHANIFAILQVTEKPTTGEGRLFRNVGTATASAGTFTWKSSAKGTLTFAAAEKGKTVEVIFWKTATATRSYTLSCGPRDVSPKFAIFADNIHLIDASLPQRYYTCVYAKNCSLTGTLPLVQYKAGDDVPEDWTLDIQIQVDTTDDLLIYGTF